MEPIVQPTEIIGPIQTSIQKSKAKYYSKNKNSISDAYKVYYQTNKLKISQQRKESYAKRRTANELAQLFAPIVNDSPLLQNL